MARDGIQVNDRQVLVFVLFCFILFFNIFTFVFSPLFFLISWMSESLYMWAKAHSRQLACARIRSQEGQDYLKAMAAAANYAWVNRSMMTFLTRQVGFSHGYTLIIYDMNFIFFSPVLFCITKL